MNTNINSSFLDKLKNTVRGIVFHLKQWIKPKLSDTELKLINDILMFNRQKNVSLRQLKKATKHFNFSTNELIVREGEEGAYLYIILSGSVRIFIYDSKNNKIILAKLNQGDYFGEQALLDDKNNLRNANVEAVTPTVLIGIHKNIISRLLSTEEYLKQEWTQLRKKQLDGLALSLTGFQAGIRLLFSTINTVEVETIPQGTLIFSEGDIADKVYFILSGEIELHFSSTKHIPARSIIYKKGQIFGELGILEHKPRSATARVKSDARLDVISGEELRENLKSNSELQRLLSALHKSYELPSGSKVEQHINYNRENGLYIDSYFQAKSGANIFSETSLDKDSFNMQIIDAPVGKEYIYSEPNKENKIILNTYHDKLVSIKAFGYLGADTLPLLCQLLIEQVSLNEEVLENFIATGLFLSGVETTSTSDDPIICECMQIKTSAVQALIQQGTRELEILAAETGACRICRCCKPRILALLDQHQNNWKPAILRKIKEHHENMRTYLISLKSQAHFSTFLPGQHILLQVVIDGIKVQQRYSSYFLTETIEDALYITVEREEKNRVSNWIFQHDFNDIEIEVLGPEGNFFLRTETKKAALCFAEGISITPFISMANSLMRAPSLVTEGKVAEERKTKRMHLVYAGKTENDFIFKDYFQEIKANTPEFSINYLLMNTEEILTQEQLLKLTQALNIPEIYISGSKDFYKKVSDITASINYSKELIFSEVLENVG